MMSPVRFGAHFIVHNPEMTRFQSEILPDMRGRAWIGDGRTLPFSHQYELLAQDKQAEVQLAQALVEKGINFQYKA